MAFLLTDFTFYDGLNKVNLLVPIEECFQGFGGFMACEAAQSATIFK